MSVPFPSWLLRFIFDVIILRVIVCFVLQWFNSKCAYLIIRTPILWYGECSGLEELATFFYNAVIEL